MSTPFDDRQKERSSTYIVQDRQNTEELARLAVQDQLFRSAMGGILPEQPDPAQFFHVLDVGCGTGFWAIEAASAYPHMTLVGVDISQQMINYASSQAEARQVDDRVTFRTMDALDPHDWPFTSFDLVNMSYACSFLRTWDWPNLLKIFQRITRPGGTIRLTETEIAQPSTSPAFSQFCEMFQCALYRSGHLFEQASDGLTSHLKKLLIQHYYQQVQTRPFTLVCEAGTPEAQAFYADAMHMFHTLRPFIQKWGGISSDYDELQKRAGEELRSPGFRATWNFVTAWGIKPPL